MTTARIKALDLFAGTGWGVACKRLGIEESGVEIMTEAVETRTANGMKTIYRDVWNGLNLTAEQHRLMYGGYGLLIASPPCQTFSMAGNGAGRAALNEVLEAIDVHAYKDAAALRAFGETHDPRTALVLAPLAYVWRDRPRLVAMEQVPTVLPVWEACAEVMREWGYEVKVEVLNAEQYGVPQTRKRAILVARRGGPVHLPVPTHSRYYPRTPDKLDPGVQKWVSMAEALGWGMTDRPYLTVTGGGDKDSAHNKHTGDPAPSGLGSKAARMRVASEREAGRFTYPDVTDRQLTTPGGELKLLTEELATLQTYPVAALKNMGAGMVERHGGRPARPSDAPAFTIRANAGGTEPGGFIMDNGDGTTRKMDMDEASALQSYPTYSRQSMPAGPYMRPDNNPRATVRSITEPASTLKAGHCAGERGWVESPGDDVRTDGRPMTEAEAATLQTYPTGLRPEVEAWQWVDVPATTIQGDPRITAREHHYHGEQSKTSLKLVQSEASTLQTYEPPFIWCGSKSKKFLQIGNAVPPLLAEAVLAALIGIRPGR